MLIDIIQNNTKFQEIHDELKKPGRIVHGLTNSAKSLILANLLQRSGQSMLFVVQNHHEALNYYNEIKNLSASKQVFNFTAQEVSPYDQINSDVSVLNSQYECFEAWESKKPSLTVITVKALAQLYLSKELFDNKSFHITKDAELDPLELAKKLSLFGYTKTSLVEARGQFSQRGDITDIFPLVGEPVRIEFFGDSIENLRTFNTSTQRSIKKLDRVKLHPRYSIIRSEEDDLVEKIKDLSSTIVQEEDSVELHYSESDPYWEGVEYYKELLGQEGSPIFDYLPSNMHIVFDEWQDLMNASIDWQKKQDEFYSEGIKQGKLIELKKPLYFSREGIVEKINSIKQKLYLQTMVEAGLAHEDSNLSYEINTYPSERFASKVEEFVQYIKTKLKENQGIVIFSEQPQRVMGILREWDIASFYKSNIDGQTEDEDFDIAKLDLRNRVLILRDGLEEGCKLPDLNLVILTDRELFGRSRQAVARQKTKAEEKANRNIYTDIAELKNGDYVVHYKHGVGMYKGTEYIELDYGHFKQEYLVIEYADEARVLLPVDQVNLLSRFNVNQEVKPRLSKLGGTEWERTKKKVRKSVKRIAQDLINLYALREKQKGYKYPPDTPWQIEIEDAFPYTETDDQLKAIAEIKQDMETEKLVDRLICGDAGFGKTEVILRAVFKVIMEGRQVAILVPTTVLAQQHFNTFSDRYAPYPIRIGLLSRFRTAKEQREVVTKLKLGEIDLVIGTHRLLQRDVQFSNIGLLVIDEEQRFGVAHKEKLKDIRKDLDVVSMSATPIPRTLHMSLSGIRDISLISTPPTNRKPVKTFVGEYKPSIIRNAILHELERGGKIFFVNNRIENIDALAFQIQELVPEASVRVGHGQMKDRELEDVMFSFVNDEFNVLVCTTIIETGLDISDANTMIINNANNFGLSQLYQLRGRVGRSDQQAYAYLLFNPEKEISETARERLKAIRELTNLGAGYQIAIRDMEIRGVGNVFGAEQHGQMLSVGFDLYCKMLSESIEQLKGNISEEELERSCTIDIKINAYFSDLWMSDNKQRMNEYRRLSMVKDEATIDALVNEWQDRFGRLPNEAQNLVEVARLKVSAMNAGIATINQEGEFIRIYRTNMRLQQWLPMHRQLSAFLQSRASFKAGAVGSRNSASQISFKVTGMESDNILSGLKDIISLLSA